MEREWKMNPHTTQIKWFPYHPLRYVETWPQEMRNVEQVRQLLSRAWGCTEESN